MIGLTTKYEIVVVMLRDGAEHIIDQPAGYELHCGNLHIYGRPAEIAAIAEEHIFPLMNVERVIVRQSRTAQSVGEG